MRTDYNASPPPARSQLWHTVQLGWAHSIEGEGDDAELVLDLDDAGEPIPTTYRIPGRVSARTIIDGVKSLGAERAEALQAGGPEALVELVGIVLGDDLVLRIAADPTVDPDAFMTFAADCVGLWGLTDALPDGQGND